MHKVEKLRQLGMTECPRGWTTHDRFTAHRFRIAAILLAVGASLGVVAPSEVFWQSSGRQSNAVNLTELKYRGFDGHSGHVGIEERANTGEKRRGGSVITQTENLL